MTSVLEPGLDDALARLVELLTSRRSTGEVIEALTAELVDAVGGSRAAVLLVSGADGLHAAATVGVSAQTAATLDTDLDSAPELRDALRDGAVRFFAPGSAVACGTRIRRAFRPGRSLLVVPFGSAHERIGLVLVEGVPAAPAGDATLERIASSLAVVACGASLAQDTGRQRLRSDRLRLATELHDGVLQQMFFVQLKLRELEGLLPAEGPARELFASTAQEMATASADLRTAVLSLTTAPRRTIAATPGQDLVTEFKALLDDFGKRSAIGWDLELRGTTTTTPGPDASGLFARALSEGLHNVHKHADATQVLVVVRRGPTWWTVEVHDDGVTNAAELRRAVASASRGFGLRSLSDVAASLGGRLWVGESSELDGMQVSLSLPIAGVAE